jgi:hypothetical protein
VNVKGANDIDPFSMDFIFCTHPEKESSSPDLLRSQSFSTLGPPAIDHAATTLCRHSFSEAMGSGAFDSARLVRTFHRLFSFFPIG